MLSFVASEKKTDACQEYLSRVKQGDKKKWADQDQHANNNGWGDNNGGASRISVYFYLKFRSVSKFSPPTTQISDY